MSIEVYNFAYNDKDGNEIRGRATLIGGPVPIGETLPRSRIQISNFRRWRDDEPEPVIGE